MYLPGKNHQSAQRQDWQDCRNLDAGYVFDLETPFTLTRRIRFINHVLESTSYAAYHRRDLFTAPASRSIVEGAEYGGNL